jgi:pimeloyl-ACP methyl ester carboxylesterase
VLVLGPSLGTDTGLFDPQVAEFARTHRVIRYDLRGHGGSEVLPASCTEVLVPSRTGTWSTAKWAVDEPAAAERLRATPAEGYAACCEVIGAFDVRDRLGEITAPTRLVTGAEDPATTVDMIRLLADDIPGQPVRRRPGSRPPAQRHPPRGGERRTAGPLSG